MTPTHRVLVSYASKNGSTAQIAQWIAETLRERGIETDVRAAGEPVDASRYTAVVLGSALYGGRWLRDAVRFTRRHQHALLERPVWLFSSGPLDATASDGSDQLPPPVQQAVRAAERVDAAAHMTFGGRLDESASGFVARRILSQGRGGDFRDRAQVRTWAAHIADNLAAGTDLPLEYA